MKLNSRSKGNNDEFLEARIGNHCCDYYRFAGLASDLLVRRSMWLELHWIGQLFDMHSISALVTAQAKNVVLMSVVLLLYVVNNHGIKAHTDGTLGYFFTCYFNDFICPILVLSYANIVLSLQNYQLITLKWIICAGFCAGIFWEYITPLYHPSSTSDIYDVLCYLLGACVYWIIQRKPQTASVQARKSCSLHV
jgi:hypothetical protein